MTLSLTFDVVGVVNDEDPIPNHRQVHWQVADVVAFIVILKYKTRDTKVSFSTNNTGTRNSQ